MLESTMRLRKRHQKMSSKVIKMWNQLRVFLVLFIIPQVLSQPSPNQINYCAPIRNCAYLKNIVCERNYKCGPVENCEEIKLKRSTKIYILLSLNEFRNDVALGKVRGFPKASDMVTQYWDDDLEYVTRCLQNTCQLREEICANTLKHTHTFTLQQALPLKDVKGEVDFFHQTIKLWTNPRLFNKSEIRRFSDETFSKYAAILWRSSPSIGCALSRDSKFYYGACTFARAPRYGERVYYIGTPCSGCPRGLACNDEYHGLCGEIMLPRAESSASGCGLSVLVLALEVMIVLVMLYT